ncbi:MAG: response regulator [Alphaproteobacteria bacterium]|nr:response regulator [Alphaproteobacteria bacterium]MBF0250178.1 response regulator [Alphaproteobacteria bacterium]
MQKKEYDFSRTSVLVVDDSRYMRKIFKEVLYGLGFGNVIEAEDGAQALKLINSYPVDIMVVDWEMPIMNGLEFVEMVRSDVTSPMRFSPVIMVTGHSEMGRIVRARDAGVDEYLIKPLSAGGLYTRLVAVIERRRRFVQTKSYFGPCRRRRNADEYLGRERRSDNMKALRIELGGKSQDQAQVDQVFTGNAKPEEPSWDISSGAKAAGWPVDETPAWPDAAAAKSKPEPKPIAKTPQPKPAATAPHDPKAASQSELVQRLKR